jgi:hypothetical protein
MEYDVNQPTFDGVTAIQFALDNNHMEVVEVLLRLQAAINEEFHQKGISKLVQVFLKLFSNLFLSGASNF